MTIRALLARIETTLIVVPAIAAILLVAWQAFSRYFYHPWLVDWADEVSVYLLIWPVLMSLGRITAEGAHVHAELLVERLPVRGRRGIAVLTSVIGLGFVVLLGWNGYRVTHEAWLYDDRTASSLRIPIWIYFSFLPLACLGMALGFALRISSLMRNGNAAGAPEGDSLQ